MDQNQLDALYDALVDAFALDPIGFNRMLIHRAKWSPGDIPNAALQTHANVAFEVTQAARRAGTELELLTAALDTRPKNPKLRALAQEVNLGVLSPPDAITLQREIVRGLPNVPIEVWRERLGQIEGWVCRIEIAGTGREGEGTGFLIGPDLVATACHVVEKVIDGTFQPEEVLVRFDYRAMSNQARVRAGTPVGLNLKGGINYPNATGKMAATWLVDSAPYDTVDLTLEGGTLPDPQSLDFAILRLAEPIGRKPSNPKGTSDMTEPPRGWIIVPTDEAGLTPPGSVMIVQHPSGKPMELALGGNGLIGLNGNGTRVRYRTNTAHAASGSPCFDLNWNLIAVHHAGDPNYALAHTAQWNQGIPFHLIAARLKKNGFENLLNQNVT